METKLISFREFRKKLPKIWKELKILNEPKHYLVLVHSKPVLEVKPASFRMLEVEELIKNVERARTEPLVNYHQVFIEYGI